jgi:hypothetical protein
MELPEIKNNERVREMKEKISPKKYSKFFSEPTIANKITIP